MTAQTRAINFKPWIGKHYWKKPFMGKRMMLVSFYPYQVNAAVPLNESHSVTTEMLLASLGEDQNTRHKQLAASMSGITGLISKDRAFRFWNSVAHYHYLQKVAVVANKMEFDEVWSNSKLAFQLVLKEVKPQVVLILRSQILDELPFEQGVRFELKRSDSSTMVRETKTLRYPGGLAVAYFLGAPAILRSDPLFINSHLRQLFKAV
jgi:hypothetical protein